MARVLEDIITHGPNVKNLICLVGPISMLVLFNWMTNEIIASAVRAPQKT